MTEAERRAEEAQRLLDSAVLREALEAIEAERMEAAVSAWTDRRRRQHLEAVKVVRDVREKLQAAISAAKYEAGNRPRRSV